MVKSAAILFGIVFLVIGILGFVPAATPANGMLLGIFHVNTAHNIAHLASGVVFLLCGWPALVPRKHFSKSLGSFMGSSRSLGSTMAITRYSGSLQTILPTPGCMLCSRSLCCFSASAPLVAKRRLKFFSSACLQVRIA
jgi:hypothetical protein